jgi:SAM-dependent methyltransferase
MLQPLARIGAKVTGIDASQSMIDTATSHACEDPSVSNSITYIRAAIEEHANEHSEFYDVVVASEVLEHVVHKDLFLDACVSSLKVRRHLLLLLSLSFAVVFWGRGGGGEGHNKSCRSAPLRFITCACNKLRTA